MNKAKLQHGFSPIVLVLILVALGVIGFVAWRVYDSITQANSSLSNAATSSNSQVAKESDKSGKEEPKTKKTVIPYIDYEIEVPDSIKDLTFYKMNSKDGGVIVYMSTKSLESLDANCDAKNGSPLGLVGKYSGQYKDDYPNGAPAKPLLRQNKNDYIAYTGPQAACSGNEEVIKQTPVLLQDLQKALGINS